MVQHIASRYDIRNNNIRNVNVMRNNIEYEYKLIIHIILMTGSSALSAFSIL